MLIVRHTSMHPLHARVNVVAVAAYSIVMSLDVAWKLFRIFRATDHVDLLAVIS